VTEGAGAPAEVLVCHGLVKSFSGAGRAVKALDGVDLTVRQGRVHGLIGPDGGGKTTLMRLAAGLLLADGGELAVLGRDPRHEADAIQAETGYMPQHFGLYEDLSVAENLDLYADLYGRTRAGRRERIAELMEMAGLTPFMRRLAGRLSGGMKQKLGLACSLLGDPRLLLLDEPTVGVDPVSRRELWQIVYRQVRDRGLAVLLSTAYLDEAERCDEVALLHRGRLLGSGVPKDFTRDVDGHAWAARVEGWSRRAVQMALSRAPGVVDTVIQGDHVRVVMEQTARPQPKHLLPGVEGLRLDPLAPRFEDAFITLMRRSLGDERAQADGAPALPSSPPPPAEKTAPVIEIRDLTRRFGDFVAVRQVSFEVGRGEVFGLLGANGAGKTTTFRMLCGLLPVSGGHATVAGYDLRRAAAAARARIGYMSQKFSLYESLSVRENLRFFGRAYGLGLRRRRRRVGWAVEHFQLAELLDARSGDLPLGYKQRLAMACALLHEPQILFLDEPTSGVDPLARREFWNQINQQAEAGVTVLVTTHFMEEAEYCDRMCIMVAGEALALGTPGEIKDAARSPEHPDPTMEDAFIQLIQAPREAAA